MFFCIFNSLMSWIHFELIFIQWLRNDQIHSLASEYSFSQICWNHQQIVKWTVLSSFYVTNFLKVTSLFMWMSTSGLHVLSPWTMFLLRDSPMSLQWYQNFFWGVERDWFMIHCLSLSLACYDSVSSLFSESSNIPILLHSPILWKKVIFSYNF